MIPNLKRSKSMAGGSNSNTKLVYTFHCFYLVLYIYIYNSFIFSVFLFFPPFFQMFNVSFVIAKFYASNNIVWSFKKIFIFLFHFFFISFLFIFFCVVHFHCLEFRSQIPIESDSICLLNNFCFVFVQASELRIVIAV